MLTTLTKRADFLAANRARRQAERGFVVQMRPRADDPGGPSRVGFTCSKKVGNAVARNRAKRRLRALARQVLAPVARPGTDYVLIGRAGTTGTLPFDQMVQDLTRALDRLHAPRAPRPADVGTASPRK